jgi:hypothetical protein
LQPRWSDRPDYTDICNIQASESGAQAIADAVWDILQRNCIAQSSARRRKPWAAVGPTRAMDAGSIHRLPRA